MQKELEVSTACLKAGQVILYPTDTVWGIGCDATNSKAVDRIYKIKERAETKSMIVLVESIEQLREYVKDVPDVAIDLIEHIKDPLTIIYPNARKLAKNVIADDGTIAIRLVRHEFCAKLIRRLGKPIVSTSANISGNPTPMVFEQISEKIGQQVDHIISLFHSKVERIKPSTIIKLEVDGSYTIIRK